MLSLAGSGPGVDFRRVLLGPKGGMGARSIRYVGDIISVCLGEIIAFGYLI